MELLDRITVEPGKRGSRPCVRGLRVTVTNVLELLLNGLTSEEVVKQLPYLEPDGVRACLACADHQRLVSWTD
jgi:uncharacterized protein (DUF433 family)